MAGAGLRGGGCAGARVVCGGRRRLCCLAGRQGAGLPGVEEGFEAREELADAAVDEDEKKSAVHQLGRMAREAARARGDEGEMCFHVS